MDQFATYLKSFAVDRWGGSVSAIVATLVSPGLAAEQELFLVIEFLHALKLCLFGPVWNEAVAWYKEAYRTHALLDKK